MQGVMIVLKCQSLECWCQWHHDMEHKPGTAYDSAKKCGWVEVHNPDGILCPFHAPKPKVEELPELAKPCDCGTARQIAREVVMEFAIAVIERASWGSVGNVQDALIEIADEMKRAAGQS